MPVFIKFVLPEGLREALMIAHEKSERGKSEDWLITPEVLSELEKIDGWSNLNIHLEEMLGEVSIVITGTRFGIDNEVCNVIPIKFLTEFPNGAIICDTKYINKNSCTCNDDYFDLTVKIKKGKYAEWVVSITDNRTNSTIIKCISGNDVDIFNYGDYKFKVFSNNHIIAWGPIGDLKLH